MQNFTFWNPTRIVFGKDTVAQIGKHAQVYGRTALLVYGRSSIKASGLYDVVVRSLSEAGISFVDFGGVRSNPVLSHVRQGVELAKSKTVDLIVAVGGGSVIDEAKAIAAGARTEGEVWDFFIDKAVVQDALPVLTVLTLAATASEMNSGGVVTNEETRQKFNINSPLLFPKVSILDPTVTFSVPADYTAYSAADAICHMLEGYFTGKDTAIPLQDSMVESLIKTIMTSTRAILKNPCDYDARATMMWSASLAFNGLTTAGIGPYGFPNHMIEHSLSALYDIAHGAGLAIVLPAWMQFAAERDPDKVARFARRVFAVQEDSDADAAEKGVQALKEWLKSIGCPISLRDAGIDGDNIPRIAQNATMLAHKWRLSDYTEAVITEILRRAL